MNLSDFAPPILTKLARRLKQSQELYNSYEMALAACRNGDEDDVVNVVYEKTRLYRDALQAQHPFVSEMTSVRTLAGLSLAISGNEVNVVDFGGACGVHYYLARAVFGERTKLRWHVVETPRMASKAVALEDGQLRFFDSVQEARRGFDHVNLIFSAGALQYVARPYECLEELVECEARRMFMTRLGLSTLSKELIVVQKSRLSANGPGPMPPGMKDGVVKYPVTFVRKDKIEAILSKRYSIRIRFNEDKDAYRAANHSIDMYGYFAELRSES